MKNRKWMAHRMDLLQLNSFYQEKYVKLNTNQYVCRCASSCHSFDENVFHKIDMDMVLYQNV